MTTRYTNWLQRARFALLWMLLIGSSLHATAAVELRMDKLNLPDGGVEFRPGSCQLVTTPGDLAQMKGDETTSYRVYVDLRGSSFANFGYFVYEFYVQPKTVAQPADQICLFRVQATPSGTFLDRVSEVAFTVGEGSAREEGSIRLPLHNTSYSSPVLRSPSPASVPTVRLTGETTIYLPVENVLPDLPVQLDKNIAATADNAQYWRQLQASVHFPRVEQTELSRGQKLDTGLQLRVAPNPWHALGASIFPIRPGTPHEIIRLTLDYNTPGGIPATLDIPVSVRFRPSFWALLAAVLIGSVLGSILARLFSPKAQSVPAGWGKSLAIACIAGVLAEVVGLVLVAYGDSRFRLLGLELDPYQLLPALLIGALVGLYGFRSAPDLLARFTK